MIPSANNIADGLLCMLGNLQDASATAASLAFLGAGRVDELSHHFRHQQPSSTAAYGLMLVVPIVAAIIGYAVYCYSNRTAYTLDAPDGLLSQLCRLHGIGNEHQFLLQTIAEVAAMENPSLLFALPTEFEAAVETAAKKMRFTKREMKAIGQLRRQMFE